MSRTYRVSIMKMNGAVWTETYTDKDEALAFLEKNIDDYPHVVFSTQRRRENWPRPYNHKNGIAV